MSIETMVGQYTGGSNFAERITRRAEFDLGHSRMRALANTTYHEGNSGLRTLWEKNERLGSTGLGKSLSYQRTPEFGNSLKINGAAVLWGALFFTTEKLLVDRVYNPTTFAQLIRDGFEGTPWDESVKISGGMPKFYPHAEIQPLMDAAMSDKTFSFLFMLDGLRLLPSHLQRDTVFTDFYRPMQAQLGPVYTPLARNLLNAPATEAELSRMRKYFGRQAPEVKPLTFR